MFGEDAEKARELGIGTIPEERVVKYYAGTRDAYNATMYGLKEGLDKKDMVISEMEDLNNGATEPINLLEGEQSHG